VSFDEDQASDLVDRPTAGAPPAATGAPERQRAWEALRYRDFRLFWVGAIISNSGSWMQRVTVPYVLFEMTGSATWVGFATFAQFLPAVLLQPIGGSLADRVPKRRLLMVLTVAMTLVALLLWLLWETGRASPWSITGTVVLLGLAFALTGPAWQAFVSELVPRSVLLNAITLNSTQFNASRATGPALAGLVLSVWGPGAAFLLNALSFGAVLVALALVGVGNEAAHVTDERARPLREFREAVRYARGFPGIVACFIAVAALGACNGPLTDLVVVFAQDVFGVGDLAYGVLVASAGVGAVLGAPLVASRGPSIPRRQLLWYATLTYGVAVLVLALAPGYGVGMVGLLLSGAAYLAIAATLNTTIQTQVADAMRGKVLAVYLMVLTLAMPVGAIVQGALTDAIGPRLTVAGAGVVFLVVVLGGVYGTGLADHLDD
jgi:MFS family permease